MKPLTSIEIKLCQKQAKIFERSIKRAGCSSPVFIRRFMHSSIATLMDKKLYLFTYYADDDVFQIIDDEFGESTYGKEKYNPDLMFWIGYIYRCICIKYNLSSKAVYKLFNANNITKYYNICHTFDIVDAAERMMESIHYDNSSIEHKAYEMMKRLIFQERLNEYLGQTVEVVIDKPINYIEDDMTYIQNYGHLLNLKTPDNKFQEAYVIGIDKPIKSFNGKVIAIINRINEGEDKLVVCDESKSFNKDEILEMVNFLEKNFKSKIVLEN